MKTSQEGINLIKKWEGFRNKAYYDSVGVLTIGYGHTNGAPSGKKYPVYEGQVISEAQGEKMLREDIANFEKAVNKYLDTNSKYVTQSNFDALVSFSYNLGASILKGDLPGLENDIAYYTNVGNYKMATKEMKLFNKAGGQTLQGLVNRRNEEVRLYLTDKPDGTIYYARVNQENSKADYEYIMKYESDKNGVVYKKVNGKYQIARFNGEPIRAKDYLNKDGLMPPSKYVGKWKVDGKQRYMHEFLDDFGNPLYFVYKIK